MIQILGLRGIGANVKHSFFGEGWTAESVPDLLKNYKEYVAKIPEKERYNMYFTLHHCLGEGPRDWKHQDVISFDIDKIDIHRAKEIARLVCAAIGVDYNKTGIVMSGHGLQLHVLIEEPIEDIKFFAQKTLLFAQKTRLYINNKIIK